MSSMRRRRGGRRCSSRPCRVGKAKRGHHAASRSGEMVGTLRFAHPTALLLISNSSNPSAAPRARGFASSCAAKIQRAQGKPGALSTRGRPSACGERRQSRRAVATPHAIGGSPSRNSGRLAISGDAPPAPSVPAGLLHSRAGLRQFFEPALDLGAGHREILELAVVKPVQGDARGVTLVACDDSREEAVDETAQARQQNCRSPGKWPGGGGRNSSQYRHGYFLSKRSRKPVSLPAPFLSKACCQHGVSRLRRGDERRTRLRERSK